MVEDAFISVAQEGRSVHRLDLLLGIYSSFVKGFPSPLKQEHLNTYQKVILPLFKLPDCQKFGEGLVTIFNRLHSKHY